MAKKKQFVNRKTAQVFSLIPRSRGTPLDETSPSLAAQYGIDFPDLDTYDYLQHMRPLDCGPTTAVLIDAPGLARRLRQEELEASTNEEVIQTLEALEDDAFMDDTAGTDSLMAALGIKSSTQNRSFSPTCSPSQGSEFEKVCPHIYIYL